MSHPDRQPIRYLEQVRAICPGFPELPPSSKWHPLRRSHHRREIG